MFLLKFIVLCHFSLHVFCQDNLLLKNVPQVLSLNEKLLPVFVNTVYGGNFQKTENAQASKEPTPEYSPGPVNKNESKETLEEKRLDENNGMNLRAKNSVVKTREQRRKELIDGSFAEFLELVEKEVESTPEIPMDQYDPDISVVIPVAFDDLRSFPVLLSVLRLQTLRPEEIILVLDFPENETVAREKASSEIKKYIGSLRNLRTFFRVPPPPPNHRPGSNRLFGASKAKNDIIIFFDSDDLMHPQRVEYVSRAFKTNKDMDVFLTEYSAVQMDTTEQAMEMPRKSMEYLRERFDLDKIEREGKLLRNSYQEEFMEAEKAVKEYGLKCPWDPNDRMTEVNWPETHGWWLYCCANGWLTIRKDVLIEVPYPDKTSGEDSLFVFRLLMSRKNLGHSTVPLGIYVLGNTYRVR
ncbi:glycosyltransferase family 2 protein [Cryptosporidium felis]|nr:glycosyltransferase family 2 protein [Cryptosporidium felis]